VVGADLTTSLQENMQASSSGVILWSSRTKDSKWCIDEHRAMETLKDRRKNSKSPFNYVFAQLDSEELPLFAQTDLYINFEDSPEGPRGVNLLKLICGMRGVPLPPEAVKMAQKVDEEAQKSMTAINGAVAAGNAARLREIGTSAAPGILASPGPMLAAAQGLISMKKEEDALEILKLAEAYFPKSIRAQQLKGLALRRLGRYQEAIDVLAELQAAGHQDPETLGILAAAWFGRYQETGKGIYLCTAQELYLTGFQADPKDYYTGINAAAKSLLLGELDEAKRLIAEVLELVKGASDGQDFYAGLTLAEVFLLQGDIKAAAALFQKVIVKHPGRTGDLAGTREEIKRICKKGLTLSEEDTKKVLAPFTLLD
jgi:tetratricopeptide (TPR) repeat protein